MRPRSESRWVLKPHGGMTGTGPQIRDAAKRVNRANFTVMYDPGNIYFYSQGAD
jgi:sugar phosphate isomerase/epimerase